jgi:hypothetical protein
MTVNDNGFVSLFKVSNLLALKAMNEQNDEMSNKDMVGGGGGVVFFFFFFFLFNLFLNL